MDNKKSYGLYDIVKLARETYGIRIGKLKELLPDKSLDKQIREQLARILNRKKHFDGRTFLEAAKVPDAKTREKYFFSYDEAMNIIHMGEFRDYLMKCGGNDEKLLPKEIRKKADNVRKMLEPDPNPKEYKVKNFKFNQETINEKLEKTRYAHSVKGRLEAMGKNIEMIMTRMAIPMSVDERLRNHMIEKLFYQFYTPIDKKRLIYDRNKYIEAKAEIPLQMIPMLYSVSSTKIDIEYDRKTYKRKLAMQDKIEKCEEEFVKEHYERYYEELDEGLIDRIADKVVEKLLDNLNISKVNIKTR